MNVSPWSKKIRGSDINALSHSWPTIYQSISTFASNFCIDRMGINTRIKSWKLAEKYTHVKAHSEWDTRADPERYCV